VATMKLMLSKALETGNTLSIRAPVGEPGGGSFCGNFERQMKGGCGNGTSLVELIWARFFGPDCVRILSLGGNLGLL